MRRIKELLRATEDESTVRQRRSVWDVLSPYAAMEGDVEQGRRSDINSGRYVTIVTPVLHSDSNEWTDGAAVDDRPTPSIPTQSMMNCVAVD